MGGTGGGFQRQQGEDTERLEQGKSDKEQDREDCEQEGLREGQEEFRQERFEEVVRCLQEGTQGAQDHRFLPSGRKDGAGKGLVCQGEEPLGQLSEGSELWLVG